MNAGRQLLLARAVKLLDLLHALDKDKVELGHLARGMLRITHRLNVIGTHRKHDAGKFSCGIVVLLVLRIDLQLSSIHVVNTGNCVGSLV